MKNVNFLLIIMMSFILITFNSCSKDENTILPNQVKDIDGNVYKTDTICGKIWMTENLKTTRYRNGDPIPNINSASEWTFINTGGFCNIDNISSNAKTYGLLYNWYAVNDDRNICPEGWHIPTLFEFLDLVNCYGGDDAAGIALKEIGYWSDPNIADNSSGFSAIPTGYRDALTGEFVFQGICTYFWNSTQYNSIGAYAGRLVNSSTEVQRGVFAKNSGFPIRCVKD